MKNCYKSEVLGVAFTLILTAMTFQVKSQNLPASDQLVTAAGNVELDFIGHGSLMFKMNDIVIYVDPVKSSGNYDNLPKADIILVTHEHSDHLDNSLIDALRKSGTVILCNGAAAAKVNGCCCSESRRHKEYREYCY